MSLSVSPEALSYFRSGRPSGLGSVVFQDGFFCGCDIVPDEFQPTAELSRLFATEPLTRLTLFIPARTALWQRIDGPHLRNLHTLAFYLSSGDTDPAEFADAVCESSHLTGLRAVLLQFDRTLGLLNSTLLDTLRRSPLRRQLTSLEVYGIRDLSGVLSDPDPGFDSLQELSVWFIVPPGEADLFGGGVSATLRGQLRQLTVSTPVADVRWLTTGPTWDKLERLSFVQSGLGTASLGALGHSTLLPTLFHLQLVEPNLTDADLFTLARSPLVERLHLLELDGPTLGDDAVRTLAGVLDRGLQRLRLRGIAGNKLWRELTARFGSCIELTAGEQLV